jgi:hypothetical protein
MQPAAIRAIREKLRLEANAELVLAQVFISYVQF